MTDSFRMASAGEARDVLILVCLPLFLALVVALVVRARSRPRLAAIYPNFSVKIEPLGRGAAFVTYSRYGKSWHFDAELLRDKQIAVRVPREFEPEVARAIAEDLEVGLKDLGYDWNGSQAEKLRLEKQRF